MQLVGVRITAVYRLKDGGWVVQPLRHEQLGGVVLVVILEINDAVDFGISEKAILKIQHVVGGSAHRAQHQMFIVAIGPEVHDPVVNYGNGGILNEDAELLGDVVGEWLGGDHTRKRLGHSSKQSKEKGR